MQLNAKPNFTAWFVMQGTLAALRRPELKNTTSEKTFALYKPLSDAASKTRLISRIIHRLPYRLQYWIGCMVTHPSRLRHFCLRKLEIERQAQKLISSGGIKQVVVLGAGLDVLAMHLAAEYPEVKFIEIDTSESQDFKVSAFRGNDVAIPDNIEFIAGDLREPLSQVLKSSKLYEITNKTLWIAEGLFMFIPSSGVARLLKEIRERSAIGSYMIFTSLASYKPLSVFRSVLQALYLYKEDSPYQWAIAFEDVADFTGRLGYQLVSQTQHHTLHENFFGGKKYANHDVAESIHIVKT